MLTITSYSKEIVTKERKRDAFMTALKMKASRGKLNKIKELLEGS